jgi:hypothetical protein
VIHIANTVNIEVVGAGDEPRRQVIGEVGELIDGNPATRVQIARYPIPRRGGAARVGVVGTLQKLSRRMEPLEDPNTGEPIGMFQENGKARAWERRA